MNLLPKWILPQTLPAFEDAESSTCLEQTYKIYQKMNELVEEYNKFVDNTNKTITNHINTCDEDHEVFATALRQEFKDFIDVVELKLMDIEQQMKERVVDDIVDEAGVELTKLVNDTLAEMRSEFDELITNASEEVGAITGDVRTLKTDVARINDGLIEVENAIDGKANKNDVYTKTEIEQLTYEVMEEVNKKPSTEYVDTAIDNAIATAITETLGGNY